MARLSSFSNVVVGRSDFDFNFDVLGLREGIR